MFAKRKSGTTDEHCQRTARRWSIRSNGVASVDWNRRNRSQRHLNVLARTANSPVHFNRALGHGLFRRVGFGIRGRGDQNAGEHLVYSVDMFVFDCLHVSFGEFRWRATARLLSPSSGERKFLWSDKSSFCSIHTSYLAIFSSISVGGDHTPNQNEPNGTC